MNVKFFLRKAKTDYHPLTVLVSDGNLSTQKSTNYKFRPEEWDARRQELKDKSSDLFLEVDMLKSSINIKLKAVFMELRRKDEYQSPAQAWEMAFPTKKRKLLPFNDYVEWYIESSKTRKNHKGELIKASTLRRYRTSFNKLLSYQSQYGMLTWESFDEVWLNHFVDFCHNTGCQTSGYIKRIVKHYKQFLAAGFKDGHHKFDEFKKLTVPSTSKDTWSLTADEVEQFRSADLSSESLSMVRDCFIITCFTGMRYSDIHNIIGVDPDQEQFKYFAWKTGKESIVPILPPVKEILMRYQDNERFRVLSNQKYNEYLKEAAKEAGLERVVLITKVLNGVRTTLSNRVCDIISSHVGRKSFCTVFYKKGFSVLALMTITGHATEAQFFEYIGVSREDNATSFAAMYERFVVTEDSV